MGGRLRTGGRTRGAGVLVAGGLPLLLVVFAPWRAAVAQEVDHERLPNQTLPQPRVACKGPGRPQTVIDAAAALDRDPDELASRLNLADALVDQGCYQDAVTVLEAGQKSHPHSSELSGKLRDVRSMVTEQTYIQGLTQAAESAKLQRNELRCTRLADISACDDALKSKPGDAQLLAARSAAAAARSDEKLAAAAESTPAETQSSQTASHGPPPTQSSSRKPAQTALPTTAAVAAVAPASSAKSAKATAPPSPNRTAEATTPQARTRVATAAAPPKPHDASVAPKAADAVAQETLAAAGELTPPTPAYSNDAPAGRSN
jgi:hypothetical protein